VLWKPVRKCRATSDAQKPFLQTLLGADGRAGSIEIVPTYLSCAIQRVFGPQFRLPGARARLECRPIK
jgi:hypothetical protein